MRHNLALGLGFAVLVVASPAPAQEPGKAQRIVVAGFGKVTTPPATADIGFSLTGEGATADAATKAFLIRKTSIEDGLRQLGVEPGELHSEQFSVVGVRGKDCEGDRYSDQPHLSTGACAIAGYLAKADMTLTIAPPESAGTVVALMSRLGAEDAKTNGFKLADEADANRRATAAALADARALAETIAAASHAHLGPLISVQDSRADDGLQEVVVTARVVAYEAPPPAPARIVSLKPKPIETSTRLTVVYEIAP